MLSKNNKRLNTIGKEIPRFGLKKLSIGVASVLLGTTVYFGLSTGVAQADTVDNGSAVQQAGDVGADSSTVTLRNNDNEQQTMAVNNNAQPVSLLMDQKNVETPQTTNQINVTIHWKDTQTGQNFRDDTVEQFNVKRDATKQTDGSYKYGDWQLDGDPTVTGSHVDTPIKLTLHENNGQQQAVSGAVPLPTLDGYDMPQFAISMEWFSPISTAADSPVDNIEWTLNYTPHTQVEEKQTRTVTVHYTYKDGPKQGQKAAEDAVLDVFYHRYKVTHADGKVDYTNWTWDTKQGDQATPGYHVVSGKWTDLPESWANVKADVPVINGYDADTSGDDTNVNKVAANLFVFPTYQHQGISDNSKDAIAYTADADTYEARPEHTIWYHQGHEDTTTRMVTVHYVVDNITRGNKDMVAPDSFVAYWKKDNGSWSLDIVKGDPESPGLHFTNHKFVNAMGGGYANGIQFGFMPEEPFLKYSGWGSNVIVSDKVPAGFEYCGKISDFVIDNPYAHDTTTGKHSGQPIPQSTFDTYELSDNAANAANFVLHFKALPQSVNLQYVTSDGTVVSSKKLTGVTNEEVDTEFAVPEGYHLADIDHAMPLTYMFAANNPDIKVTVAKDAPVNATLTVNYVDLSGNQVSHQAFDGYKYNQVADLSKLNLSVPEGYILADNQHLPSSYTLNLQNSFTLVVKSRLSTSLETRDVVRTINVHKPDGKIASIKQTVTFARSVAKDLLTSQQTFTDWQPVNKNSFEAYVPELIDGYDVPVVGSKLVKADDQDSTVDVTYQQIVPVKVPKFVDNNGKESDTIPVGYHVAKGQMNGKSQLILKDVQPVVPKTEFVTRIVKIEMPNGKVRTIRQRVMKGKKFGNVRLPKLRGYREVVSGGDLSDNTANGNVTITVKFAK